MQSYSNVSSDSRKLQVVRSTPLGPWIGHSPGQRERLAKPPPRRFVVDGVQHSVEAQHLATGTTRRFSASLSVCLLDVTNSRVWRLTATSPSTHEGRPVGWADDRVG